MFTACIGRLSPFRVGLVAAVFFVAVVLVSPISAGQKPSVESCEEMGMLDITCFICDTGEYVGMISVKAEYDSEYGDCGNRYREARRKCSEFYGFDLKEIGCRWSHTMGGTSYGGWYPEYCNH